MSSCNCGARWTGLRMEHCRACHATFSGTTAGDMHRVGDHAVFTGPTRRRCLTPAEMLEKGMESRINAHGTEIWTTGRAQEGRFYVFPHESAGLTGEGRGNVPPTSNEAVTEMGVGR